MHVIVNFEMIPESNKVYILNVSDGEYSDLQKIHGKYINCIHTSDEEDLLINALSERLADLPKGDSLIANSDDFYNNKPGAVPDIPIKEDSVRFIQTGFIC